MMGTFCYHGDRGSLLKSPQPQALSIKPAPGAWVGLHDPVTFYCMESCNFPLPFLSEYGRTLG